MFPNAFAAYLPQFLLQRLAAHPNPFTEPTAERVPGALLFADISGFTALSEYLAESGPQGAEELSHFLNDYFGQLIDTIRAHGGDVVKFAGDALLALWPAQPAPLAEVTATAAQCALTAQNRLRDYEVAGRPMSLRIAISAGAILIPQLGGTYGRWEYLLAGEPILEISRAEKAAPPGQVVLAPSAWALIATQAEGERVAADGYRLQRVTRLVTTTLQAPALPEINRQAEAALRAYVPAAIRERLSAGQTGWLAELRRVTVLFVNLPGFNHTVELDRAQTAMLLLQRATYQFEGSINKLNVDDKGVTLVAAFGLPPLTHVDDPLRGAQAALTIRAKMREQGYEVAIGITTGRVFCGAIGNDHRREYTFIGNGVNLAARLMQAAPNDILCDAATYQAAGENLKFAVLAPILVKGRADPVAIYRPLTVQNRAKIQQTAMVGRVAERAVLATAAQRLRDEQRGSLIVLEGEPGIGKSRLVTEAVEQAAACGLMCFVGAGDAIEKSTPYHAWREVFTQIFDLHLFDNADQRRRHVRLALGPERLRLAPLLNEVLALDLPPTPLTEQMTGQVRADNLRELLVQVLQISVKRSPKVLIIEDAHWLDSASWALLEAVAQRVQPLVLLVATRPLTEPIPLEYAAIVGQTGAQALKLDALSTEEAVALACQRLQIKALPPAVVELIRDKAEGHPFFSEELAYSLRDAGLLTIQDGVCAVTPGVDLRQVAFPDTVQGVITSRIDRLTPQQQLALKTASVIGRVFAFGLLRDIYPIETDKPNLDQYLRALERLDLTPLDSPEPELAYVFKHIITREVAYNLMLFAQRQQLHQAVAEWYERTFRAELSPHYTLLAYHWTKAGALAKAVDYVEKAGQLAHRNGIYREVIDFFNEAWRLAGELPTPLPPERLGHWEMHLGLAYLALGQLGECGAHLHHSLALLRYPMPTSAAPQVGALLWEALKQLQRRLSKPGAPIQSAALDDAVAAYDRLGETYFFNNQTLPTLYCTFRGLNLAEKFGPSSRLARAYVNLAITTGLIPNPQWAEMYLRLAYQTVAHVEAQEGGPETSPTRAMVLSRASVYKISVGRWDEVLVALREAEAIFRRLGNWRWLSESLALRESVFYFTADLAASQRQAEETIALASRIGNKQHLAWAYDQKIAQAVRIGDYKLAIAMTLRDSLPLAISNKDGAEELICHCLLAHAYWHIKDPTLARQAGRQALAMTQRASMTSFSLNRALEHMGAVWFKIWEAEPRDAEARQAAQSVVALYQRYANVFPIGRPRAALYRGWAHWLNHQPNRAEQHWQRALAQAEIFKMPYEKGLALLFLARLAPASEQAAQRQHARAILAPLGVVEGRE